MKIFVAGTRGIPDIPGGVEKHCQQLYPRLAAMGHEVIVCTRSCYILEKQKKWQGVKLRHLFAPRKKSLEAIVHTFLAVVTARFYHPDILHIHAIGPSLITPLARLLGLKVVVTNHGPDYDRQNWGSLAKFVLRLGEKLGGIFANEVIVISNVIADIVRARCRREVNLLYNGVSLPDKTTDTDFLDSLGIQAGSYILAVARFVPEKGLHDLIEAFCSSDIQCQLVIAGDADHETDYSLYLKKMAASSGRIVLTGYVTGEKLNQLYSHARLFVLPSYHEGLPIVLLEAMSYGLAVLVSDIPANLEVDLPKERFFRCGDVESLRENLISLFEKPLTIDERQIFLNQVKEKYDWDKIAQKTLAVYQKVLEG